MIGSITPVISVFIEITILPIACQALSPETDKKSLPDAPHYPAKQPAWEPPLACHTLSTASIVRLCDLLADHLSQSHRAMAGAMTDWLASLSPDHAGDYATFYSMHDGKTPVFGSADGRDVFDETSAMQKHQSLARQTGRDRGASAMGEGATQDRVTLCGKPERSHHSAGVSGSGSGRPCVSRAIASSKGSW
ncbi:MAG: hypothetical protein ACIAXF_01185 [Phycisphaerales bacterium JB063]